MANIFPFSDPVGVSRLTAQAIGLEAIDHRRGQGGLSQPMHGNTFGTLSGVFPGGTAGAGASNDLAFTSASGLLCNFNAGHYGCDRGGGSLYLGMAFSGWNITLDDGDATNPRIDMVVIRNRDPGVDGSGVTETARPTILKGTPAANPTKPTGQLTSGDVPLWSFTVGGGSNYRTVLASEDERFFIVARGGIFPRRPGDNRPGAYEGQYRDNLDSNALERWSGDTWEPVATRAAWTQFTPKLYSDAGECNLGANGSAFGRYQITGKIMHIRMEFRAVRPCNMGEGYISTRLPGGVKSAAQRESHLHCKMNTIGGGIWLGDCFVPNDSNYMWPYFPNSQSDCRLNSYRVAVQAATPGQSTPLIANGYADPGILAIQGTLEIQ